MGNNPVPCTVDPEQKEKPDPSKGAGLSVWSGWMGSA